MWRREKTYRRIKRRENFNRGPYWSLFLIGSLCAHVFFYIVVSGPLLFFFTALQRHEPEQTPLTYVTFEKIKSRLADASVPAKTAMPAASVADTNMAKPAADAPQGNVTPDGEDAVLHDDGETAIPPLGEVHVSDSELLASPGKDDGVTFIRGDTLTVENYGEKKNATETKEKRNVLARLETTDSGRFRPYSTVKDAAPFRYGTSRAMTEPARPTVQRLEIGSKMPSSEPAGVRPAASDTIGKETSSVVPPGKLPPAVSTAIARQKDLISAKASFAYASKNASAVPGPVFSDLSQKKQALPGRIFAAGVNQAEPAKARAIKNDEDGSASSAPPAVRLTSPAAGKSDKKVVLVKGMVSGYGIVSVVLTLGGRQRELLVRGGEFESEVALDEGRNLIRVNTADASGVTAADMVEVVYNAPVDQPKTRMDLIVRIEYNAAGATLSTTHKWAPHPLSKGSGQAASPEFKVDGGSKGGTVSVSRALPGIYTVGVGYDTTVSGPVEATFDVTVFGHDSARRKNRKIGPVRLEGKGSISAVRLLLPEGVFWEDDGWFSGVMESGRITTKYKMPEGIVWKERD